MAYPIPEISRKNIVIKLLGLIIVYTTAVSPIVALSQNANPQRLTSDELPSMEEKRWAIFNENSLWGYINGGADIYLEYGFQEMTVQDIVWQGEKIKVDAYLMNSPEAAFGIFSVSRFGCQANHEALEKWYCIGNQQVQIIKGNLYLSVIAYNVNKNAIEIAKQVAKKIVTRFDGAEFHLPNILTDQNLPLKISEVKLITGQLAMQNSFSSMEEVFATVADYQLWVAPVEIDSADATILLANFSNDTDCNVVAEKISLSKDGDDYKVVTNGARLLAIKNSNGIDPLHRLLKVFELVNP